MNWFLASIGSDGMDGKGMNIEEMIRNEYKQSVTSTTFRLGNCYFAFASNRGNLPSKIEFGQLIILGDFAIHNKRELVDQYHLDRTVGCSMEAGELIGCLYEAKGIAFVQDLVGEFSFVLYDQRSQNVYAVRDHMGVKTLYWTPYQGGYVIASDLFLLQSYFSIGDLDEDYFKEFYERNGIVDAELTPYKNVYRVSSGSYMVAAVNESMNSTKFHRFWDLADLKGMLAYDKESDYIEEFSELLYRAVQDRLVRGKNAVMLSGGLDSTSIYSLAKKIAYQDSRYPVSSVSAVFDELKECDEREFIEELLDKYQDQGVYVNLDDRLMFEKFPYDSPFSFEPSVSSTSFEFPYYTLKAAADQGMYNILSGFAGDHLLTGSLHVTRDFLMRGKWKKALSYVTDYSIQTNSSAWRNFIDYTLFPDVIKENLFVSDSCYYKYMRDRMKGIKYASQKEMYFQISHAKSHHYSDRVLGAVMGVDIHHPFLDRRLVEFVYRIPGELRFSEEYQKYILREAMRPHLTQKIVTRINKTTHLAYTYKGLRRHWDKVFDIMSNPEISDRLNLISETDWIEKLRKWRNGVEKESDLWTLFAIKMWLVKYNCKLDSHLV